MLRFLKLKEFAENLGRLILLAGESICMILAFEAIFHQRMIVKGRSRDAARFFIIDADWPTRKGAFETWLRPSSFDEQGRQKTSLSAL